MPNTAFEAPRRVEFIESRWHVTTRITDASGQVHEFVASADAFYTERSSIWFGTKAEHEEQANS